MVMMISLRLLSQAWGTTLKNEYLRAKILKTSQILFPNLG